MHTFHLISKKIIGFENYHENNRHIFSTIHTISFFIFTQKTYSIQNKFSFLNETIENIFYTDEMKECFLDNFNKIQKTYNAFSRLAFLYKYKKAKIMVNTDLIMNEIKENEKYVYCLFQNNYKYLFNIHELVKITHNSIAYSYHFFSNPMPIKNPYNNIAFNKSTLYNIYFFIKSKTSLHPELFYYFFKTNFDLNKFVKKYQYLLRNFSIKNYLTNSTKNSICDDIDSMIENYNSDVYFRKSQIIIDETFPKDLLIKIMQPYLELYITSQYSLLYTDRIQCKEILKKKLTAFNKFNPLFGRKIYKKTTDLFQFFGNSSTRERFEYNSKHIHFFETEISKEKKCFLEDHAYNLIGDYHVNDEDEDNEEETDEDNDSDHDNNSNNTNNSDNDELTIVENIVTLHRT
jgi:hypothetical protein